jgi:hypothetical protein
MPVKLIFKSTLGGKDFQRAIDEVATDGKSAVNNGVKVH